MAGLESDGSRDRFLINPFVHPKKEPKKEPEQESSFATHESVELPPTPDAPVVLENLLKNALLLVDNGDYRLAIGLLRNILARDAYYADAIEWLGYCFQKIDDLENALRCYSELVKLQPDEYSYSSLAEVLYQLEREKDAEEFYKKALEAISYDSPLLFGIHKNLGNISVKSGDLESAEENYNKAYALNPHSDLLFVNYGTLELQKGNIETALERYRDAVGLNSQNDRAWVGIALIHREKGDKELAFANIEKALDINLLNSTALKVFVDWSVTERRYDDAIEKLETFLAVKSDDVEISLMLVECFYRKGEFLNSRIELERAAMLSPDRREINVFRDLLTNEGV